MCRIASTSRRSAATGVCRASSDLDALLDREVAVVDLVVEGDHLVGELDVVAARARSSAAAQRAQDEVALLLERAPRAGRAPRWKRDALIIRTGR